MISSMPFSPITASERGRPASTDLNGSVVLPLGMPRRRRLDAVDGEDDWKYIGCSVHSVPSLSKVAMRSGTGIQSRPPGVVVRATNSTIDCLAGPSFQDGNGSPCAHEGNAGSVTDAAMTPPMNDRRCIAPPARPYHHSSNALARNTIGPCIHAWSACGFRHQTAVIIESNCHLRIRSASRCSSRSAAGWPTASARAVSSPRRSDLVTLGSVVCGLATSLGMLVGVRLLTNPNSRLMSASHQEKRTPRLRIWLSVPPPTAPS